jgi:hypothetical protein
MKNKILRYFEFSKVNESNDTPESYVKGKLSEIKKEIEDLFEEVESSDEQPETISIEDVKNKSPKSKKKLTGVELQSCEISLYSQTDDNLTVKYSDVDGIYDLLFSINIKNSLPKDGTNFSTDDIDKIFVKFKKYTTDDISLIGAPISYTFDMNVEDNKTIFSLGKESQEGQEGQEGQNNEKKPKEEFEGDVFDLLEFLKIKFEDKYGDTGLEIEK